MRYRCVLLALAALQVATAGAAAATGTAVSPAESPANSPADSGATLASTRDLFQTGQEFWKQQLAALGASYRPAMLVLFGQPMDHFCSVSASVTGPFYCPDAETIYLDEGFLHHLAVNAGAGATTALGYVVAHELAHHMQSLLGTTQLVDQARARSTREMAARTLVTFELQADCYAGLELRWAARRGSIAAPAELAAALPGVLRAVAATAQWQQTRLHPGEQILDPLTHGTEAQRLAWLQRGLDTGDLNACDTFGAAAAGKL